MTNCCEYCKGSKYPDIHFPSNFDDREESRDGKVFIARCDECGKSAGIDSDIDAAELIHRATGWPIQLSYDSEDSIDADERIKAKGKGWYRPYFAVTINQANTLMG